jgi:hypothetical protein
MSELWAPPPQEFCTSPHSVLLAEARAGRD